jgi:hypothetical protein
VSEKNPRLRARLAWSTAIAVGAVVGATVLVPSYGGAGTGEAKALMRAYQQATQGSSSESQPHTHGDSGFPGHVHDPALKNSISQSSEAGDTTDPTTPAEAQRAIEAVEAQRAEPDPELTEIPKAPSRTTVPQSRYAMAGGCYGIQAPDGSWVVKAGDTYAATGKDAAAAEPFHFQATDLGSYLLFDSAEQFVATDSSPLGGGVVAADAPDETGVWTVKKGSGFTFGQGDSGLAAGDPLTLGETTTFKLRLTDGCARWPEITTNIGGRTFKGVSPFQEVRGTIDAHTHGMAFEFLGGGAHCGRPWSPFGVTVALVDCPDHEESGGVSPLETALNGSPSHDPVGWPTFKDWPAPDSLTHEGTYYKWIERAWQGGLRLFVNLLVENNQLCQLYPIKSEKVLTENPTCKDMKTVRWEAQDMRDLERYIDAQYGGPGKGWYRIVTNPFEARKVINQGKLAVIMGIETSIPFGCTYKGGQQEEGAQCTSEQIDKRLRSVYKMGVRQMELVNKFDNALSGITGDAGETGVLVNSANFNETQSFWQMEKCPDGYAEGVSDKEQYAVPEDGGLFDQRDGLFGAIAAVSGLSVPAIPLYGPAPHCNERGLTELGKHLIEQMAQRGMIFDPDHMSVSARKSSLDLLEQLQYPGVVSSHSWSTPDAYPRIYELGGTVFPYAGDSTGFVDKWRQHLTWADPRYYFGFGYGADINGLGAQGDPRGADVPNPVTYPFKGWGGVTVNQQRSGERVYDLNVDGVAHYGLYPDWLKDLELIADEQEGDGADITADMQRGAEAYLQMWERALGVSNDACRQPSVAKSTSLFDGLQSGLTVREVLLEAGQPHARLSDTFTYCARKPGGGLTRVKLEFTPGGRLR